MLSDAELFALARRKHFPATRTSPSGLYTLNSSTSWKNLIRQFKAGKGTPLDRDNVVGFLNAIPDRK